MNPNEKLPSLAIFKLSLNSAENIVELEFKAPLQESLRAKGRNFLCHLGCKIKEQPRRQPYRDANSP